MPGKKKYATVFEHVQARCVVDEATGCWVWSGSTVKGGYGQLQVGSKLDGSLRYVMAHVASWEAVNGPKPAGLVLDHFVCDNPPCCNPEHLRAVTQQENVLRSRAAAAANAAKVCCPKCGGPFEPRGKWGRQCRPCRLAYFRAYNAANPYRGKRRCDR